MTFYNINNDVTVTVIDIPQNNTLIQNYHKVKSCANCYYCRQLIDLVCERDFPILSMDNLQAYKVDDKHICDEWKES